MHSTDQQYLPQLTLEGAEEPISDLPPGDLLSALADNREPAEAIEKFLAKLGQQFGFGPVVELAASYSVSCPSP